MKFPIHEKYAIRCGSRIERLRFLLLFYFLLSGCGTTSRHELNVPEHVVVTPAASDQPFPGTRVSGSIPKGYELVKNLIRFQKNENTFIQVIEYPSRPFEANKLKQGMADAIRNTVQPKNYFEKEFMLGKYNALVFYGPDTKPNTDQIVLIFGDSGVTVFAAGNVVKDDLVSREEVLHALLSLYVDTSMVVDPGTLGTFSVDLKNTEFKYAGNQSQSFFYNLTGKNSQTDDAFGNQIIVTTFPSMKTDQDLKQFALSMIKNYKDAGIEIPSFTEKEIKLNGSYGYEIIFNGSFKNRSNSAYVLVTGNRTASALFTGVVYDRKEELLPQIQKIGETLRIKE